MPAAYSYDLRKKAIQALDEGESKTAVANFWPSLITSTSLNSRDWPSIIWNLSCPFPATSRIIFSSSFHHQRRKQAGQN